MAAIMALGGNFAGLTAALELSRRLGRNSAHQVTVVSPSENFLYVPSLIWLPFGKRRLEDISFPVAPMLERKGIGFLRDRAVWIEPDRNVVHTAENGELAYDYLVVATGASMNFEDIPGYAEGHTQCIVSPEQGARAYAAFQELVRNPGPVVVGAVQGASCMGAAYEYLFNMERELRRHGVRDRVELTWITPEPYLGHFGIDGIRGGKWMLEKFFKLYGIRWHVNASIKEVQANRIVLADGRELPYSMSMLMPPFRGTAPVRNSPGLGDEKGFLPCDDSYRHERFANIYSAGLAVQVKPPFGKCAVAFGVPKTGYPSDVQGKIVAHNIANALTGKTERKSKAFGKIPGICIMDAGGKEVLILTDHLFKPRRFELMMPNMLGSVGKLLLERYMLSKNRLGWAFLP